MFNYVKIHLVATPSTYLYFIFDDDVCLC